MQSNWKHVWNRRGINVPLLKDTDKILSALISMDGFDSSLSVITPKNWKAYITFILKEMKIKKGESIFEIGCGAGALLYGLFLGGYKVGGIDYSDNMISEAKKYLPNMDISICEGVLCSTNEQYDAVLSNSTFSYFPDYDYATTVIEKMFVKAKKAISILDIPNLACKEESERIRGMKIENYQLQYRDTRHLYYSKEWFIDFAKEKNCEVKIINQSIENYGNNQFRFNCFIWK